MLYGRQATDEALANLRGMSTLESVYIWDAELVSDDGARWLTELPNLKMLHLSGSQISDQTLARLAKLATGWAAQRSTRWFPACRPSAPL